MNIPFSSSSKRDSPAESLAVILSVNMYFPSATPIFSLEFQEAVELDQSIVLSVEPFKVIPPPCAVMSVGASTCPSSIFLSSTDKVVELIMVCVPSKVKSPPTYKSPSTTPAPPTYNLLPT